MHAGYTHVMLNREQASQSRIRPASYQRELFLSNLSPKGPKSSTSLKLNDRIKDRHLSGSDLYVVRLRRQESEMDSLASSAPIPSGKAQSETPSATRDPKDRESRLPQLLAKSLHDELRTPKPQKGRLDMQSSQSMLKEPSATQSKPCYRCVSYMYSAGIKRAFWTNAKGEWEGAKVRELVDALEHRERRF